MHIAKCQLLAFFCCLPGLPFSLSVCPSVPCFVSLSMSVGRFVGLTTFVPACCLSTRLSTCWRVPAHAVVLYLPRSVLPPIAFSFLICGTNESQRHRLFRTPGTPTISSIKCPPTASVIYRTTVHVTSYPLIQTRAPAALDANDTAPATHHICGIHHQPPPLGKVFALHPSYPLTPLPRLRTITGLALHCRCGWLQRCLLPTEQGGGAVPDCTGVGGWVDQTHPRLCLDDDV